MPKTTLRALSDRIVYQRKLRQISGLNDEMYLFADEQGRIWNPNSFSRIYGKLAKVLDIPGFNFQALRHTHATRLLENGINIKVVSERLGHTDVSFTLRSYVHAQPRMELLTSGVMSRLVDGIMSRISSSEVPTTAKETNGQITLAEELEVFLRIRCGESSAEDLMKEYKIDLGQFLKIEQMGVEEALDALRQIEMENIAESIVGKNAPFSESPADN